jgi:predicted transcriptional regulator
MCCFVIIPEKTLIYDSIPKDYTIGDIKINKVDKVQLGKQEI